jgi:glutathione peroxidase
MKLPFERSGAALRVACGLAVIASAMSLTACGNTPSESSSKPKETTKPADGDHGHKHAEGETCPLCEARKEEEAAKKAAEAAKAGNQDSSQVRVTTIAPTAIKETSVLNFTINDIDGKPVDLRQYAGKVVLMVNVASKCGFTRQYAGLEALHDAKKDAGLVILGFPANDFGGQEPGSESDIKQFCSTTYGVSFPMFSKISVVGPQAHPLFKRLTEQAATMGGAPSWNFTKYLIDRQGNLVARYGSSTAPDDKGMVAKIDELLAKK